MWANDNSVFIDRPSRRCTKPFRAVVLVALVIFVFLRTLRASIIPLVTIPVSTDRRVCADGAFSIIAQCCWRCLAIGWWGDFNSFWKTSNATSMRCRCFRLLPSSGAKETGFAVLPVTLAAVYAPAGSRQRTGCLFAGGGVFVALTLSPMMCSKLLKHNANPGWFDRGMERVLTGLSNGYAAVLAASLKVRWLVLLVMVGSAVGTLGLAEHQAELAAGRPGRDSDRDQQAGRCHDGLRPAKYTRAHWKNWPGYTGVRPGVQHRGQPTVAQANVFLREASRGRSAASPPRRLPRNHPRIAGLPGVSARFPSRRHRWARVFGAAHQLCDRHLRQLPEPVQGGAPVSG